MGILLTAAACRGDDDDGGAVAETEAEEPTTEEATSEAATEPATEITIVATSVAISNPSTQVPWRFDKDELAVLAGAEITITVDNQDPGTSHNFAVYTDERAASAPSAALAASEVAEGPSTQTVVFTAPAAGETLYFQCDPHPRMNGTITAQ